MDCIIKDIPLFFEISGPNDGHSIVVLHGTPLDHKAMQACLEPIFEMRRDKWKRFYLDLPGHGKSPAANWIVDNDQMVDIIVGFIESVIPEGNFSIVGESYGGYLARGVLNRLFDRIDGLFLWTPAKYPRLERKKRPPRLVRVKDDNVAKSLETSEEKNAFGLLVVQSKEAMEFMRKNVLPGWRIADGNFINEKVSDTKFSFEAESRHFEKPTLILCGRQDFVVGYEDAFELLDKYPMATFAILDEAGHTLGFTEQTQLFKNLVDEWLERVQKGM